MDGTLALLISLIIAIEVAIPVGTFLLFKGRHDDKTRLWFISVICASSSIVLVALRPFLPEYLSHQIPWVFMVSAFLLMMEAVSRELRPTGPWKTYFLVLLLWVVIINIIYFLDMSNSLGFIAYSLCISTLGLILVFQTQKLYKLRASKSLRILQTGFLFYSIPAIARVIAYLVTGSADQLDVFKFSMVTNFLVFTYVLAALFVPFGYWGFTLEKTQNEREQAEAAEDRATQSADRYRQLVEERDQLLVMNSRFSVVSSLSSFSAMLIHDITQPLQTLQLGLERVRANLVKGATRNQIEDDLLYLEKASDRAGELVLALRSLMQSGEKQATSVPLKPLIHQVEEILGSEALQKKVTIHFDNMLPETTAVWADRVMLQRIIINLVSNALNHFALTPVVDAEVMIRMQLDNDYDQEGVSIVVQDNGGGFPQALLERVGQPWSSHQPHGMGMALMLSKQLLAIWGGQLQLSNRSDGISGALVRVWLRQVG